MKSFGQLLGGRAWTCLASLCALLGCASVAKSPKLIEHPSHLGAASQLAQVAELVPMQAGRERALAVLRKSLALDPDLWEARYNLGVLLAEKGELGAAERELTQAFKAAPDAEDVAVALAEVRRRLGDPAGAIAALEDFARRNPDSKIAPVLLLSALREGGKLQQAMTVAQSWLVRHPNDPNALAELALAHLENDAVETAELLVEGALKANLASAATERAAGLIDLKKGDDAAAFLHFARASELDPKDPVARLNIAVVLLQAGVHQRAAREFRTVLEAEPNNSQAELGLAAALRASGGRDDTKNYLEVEQLLKSVLNREPNNFFATYNLAILYADHLKRPDQAIALFRRFLAEAPANLSGRSEAERRLAGAR